MKIHRQGHQAVTTQHDQQHQGRGGMHAALRQMPDMASQMAALSPVQAKSDTDLGAGVQGIASRGVAGAGGPLPHLDRIQQSFGHHDVSGARGHVGGAAGKAAKAIGASAYATNGAAAFASSPDLHTAAHEAAHIVQQRGGVQLYGGVGKAGDAYERHADAVADRVVAGKSAVDLLDQYSGGGGATTATSTGAVQRKASEPDVSTTYVAWCRAIAGGSGKSINHPDVVSRALHKTQVQVGDHFYYKWLNSGGLQRAIPGQFKELELEKEPEKKEKAAPAPDLSPAGLHRAMVGRAKKMAASALLIHQAVVRVEHQTKKLSTPDGAKGFAARMAAGGMGLIYGVGANAAKYGKDQVDKAKEFGKELGKAVVGAEHDDKKLDKPPLADAGKKKDELSGTASTSIEMLTGRLQQLFKQTRPSYGRYQAAYQAFDVAKGAFFQCDSIDLAGLNKGFDGMSSALQRMAATAGEYESTCNALGIPAKAVAVDQLSAAIVKGITSGVELAVGQLSVAGPTEAPKEGLKEKGKEWVEGQVKDMAKDRIKKELEKAATQTAPKEAGLK